MHIATFIHQMLNAGAHDGLLPVAIVLSTLLLEDVSAVFAGILASQHHVPYLEALAAVALGVAIYDFSLYSFGRVARTHPRLRSFVEHERVAPLKSWLHEQLAVTLLTAAFLPGFRFPTNIAAGFFGVPLEKYAPRAAVAIVIWSITVFTAAYLFGYFSVGVLGFWRWPIALVVIGCAFLYGRNHFNKLKALPREEGSK
jgi:membrane protein DedA with SNARE-associated domain